MCDPLHSHVDARGARHVSSSEDKAIKPSCLLPRDGTSHQTIRNSLIWVLAGQRAPRICQSAPPGLWLQELHPYYIFIWVLGIWTWVLCLHRKHSCTLKHLSQAHCMSFCLIKRPCLPLGSYNLKGLNHSDRKTLTIKLQWYLTSIILVNRQLWVLHFSADDNIIFQPSLVFSLGNCALWFNSNYWLVYIESPEPAVCCSAFFSLFALWGAHHWAPK